MATEQTDHAHGLVMRIEGVLATLQVMITQERPEVATLEDISTLYHVADKLERTEDAWSFARQIADGVRQMADAKDEQRTQECAFGPAVQR